MNDPDRKLPRTRSCFVCGAANPLGLNLPLEVVDGIVTARFTPRPEHAGFTETVHGGLLSTVLDEVMVWACGVAVGRFAYCAELSVRFLAPARPGTELVVTGELVTNRRDRLYQARARVVSGDDTVHATATGKYLPVSEEIEQRMAEDFIEDVGGVLRRRA